MALATIFPALRKQVGTSFLRQKAVRDKETNEINFENSTPFAVQVTLTESYDFNADISDNPVEKGLDITDNINIRPLEISLTMKQSDTPIALPTIIGAAVTGAGILGSQVAGAAGQKIASGVTSLLLKKDTKGLSRTCYEEFRKLFESKSLITVQTGLDLFPNMAIASIQFNRNQNTGKSIDFTVRLRQIRLVSSLAIDVPIKKGGIADQAKKRVDIGRQETNEITDNKRRSYLVSLKKVIFGS
jgi:hypothetical protein